VSGKEKAKIGQAIFVIAVVVISGVFLFTTREKEFNPNKVTNYPPSGDTIVAFGDSLVFGVGAKKDGGFVTLLSENLGVEIVNLGRGGDTTAQGLARMNEVTTLKPDIVLLLLGGNDYFYRVPRGEIFSNLEKMIIQLHKQGSIVILLGIRGGLLGDSFEDDFRKLARKQNTAHVSNILEGLLGNSEFMSDAIHPNDIGYKIIADRIEPILQRLIE